jgi:hypothetical protein
MCARGCRECSWAAPWGFRGVRGITTRPLPVFCQPSHHGASPGGKREERRDVTVAARKETRPRCSSRVPCRISPPSATGSREERREHPTPSSGNPTFERPRRLRPARTSGVPRLLVRCGLHHRRRPRPPSATNHPRRCRRRPPPWNDREPARIVGRSRVRPRERGAEVRSLPQRCGGYCFGAALYAYQAGRGNQSLRTRL